MQSSLPAGWLAFTGRVSNPLDREERFQISHAERIVVLLGDEIVADHPRQSRRDQIIYDPWHYLPVLMKKPGALRNGARFKDWALPSALTQVHAPEAGHRVKTGENSRPTNGEDSPAA
jgi:hypothetical protein